jgi:hypothetical protein
VKNHKRSLRKPRLKRLHYLHPLKGRFHIAPCRIVEASDNWLSIFFLDEKGETQFKSLVVPTQLTFEEPYDRLDRRTTSAGEEFANAPDKRYDQWLVGAMRLTLPISEQSDAVAGQDGQGSKHPADDILLWLGYLESFLVSISAPILQLYGWHHNHGSELSVDRPDAVLQIPVQA